MFRIEMYKKFTMRMRHNITIKYNGICQECGKKGKLKVKRGCYLIAYDRRKNWLGKYMPFEIHHIKPILKGGTNKENNLTLLCYKCHRSKIHKGNNGLA